MLVVLRPEAEQELLETQTWYESKALGLGFEFARAADAAVASALRNNVNRYARMAHATASLPATRCMLE